MDVILSDSEKYVQFFMGVLEFALFPHARRPNSAASFSIENRDIAWRWTADQIKQNVMDENWVQEPNLSTTASIFARSFTLMSKCRSPLFIPKTEAEK